MKKNIENVKDFNGEDMIDPKPDVIYQMNMEYLAELLLIMCKKYNEEYVW